LTDDVHKFLTKLRKSSSVKAKVRQQTAGHPLIDHRRISLGASRFETRNRFHESVLEAGRGKSFAGWRPLSRCNPIHTPKPPAKAIMQTFLLFLALQEPSPGSFLIAGAVSLGLLAIFLHHKLG